MDTSAQQYGLDSQLGGQDQISGTFKLSQNSVQKMKEADLGDNQVMQKSLR